MPSPPRSPFIVSAAVDLPLIVGAPLLCAALLLPLARVVSTQTIWVAVMALGAVGHHLPGFLRTYGDRELWRRHRLRLLVAPPLLFAATLLFALRDLHGMALVSLAWSIWHGMMQHYGFVRVYDAKAGRAGAPSARLDWWLAASWFALCLLWSPHQAASLLDGMARSGLGLPPPAALALLTHATALATAAITLVYLTQLRRGRGGWLKLGLIASTMGFVYLARVATSDAFLSVALFELLHDVQYLAIVWAFNRRRVDGGAEVRPLVRRLFGAGRRAPLVYVGACLAYGALGLAPRILVDSGLVKEVLLAALTTSGLLHFYYDGFIWKVREQETRRALGLGPAGAVGPRRTLGPLAHGLAFAAPIALLFTLEAYSEPRDPLERARAMAALVPSSAAARNDLGSLLLERHQVAEAVRELEQAIALDPGHVEARSNLGVALLGLGQPSAALAQLEVAARLRPDLGGVARNTGDALANLGRNEEALARYTTALAAAPGAPEIEFRIALVLARAGRSDEALAAFAAALGARPSFVEAHAELGRLLATMGLVDQAAAELRRALAIDPRFDDARQQLAALQPRRSM